MGGLWLVAIFIVLRLADAGVYRASFFVEDRAWQLQANVLVSVLWTTVLLVGVWQRKNWARYLLILLLLYVGSFTAYIAHGVSTDLLDPGLSLFARPLYAILGAAILYLAAGLLFIRSRRLRHLAEKSREGP